MVKVNLVYPLNQVYLGDERSEFTPKPWMSSGKKTLTRLISPRFLALRTHLISFFLHKDVIAFTMVAVDFMPVTLMASF